MPNNKTFSLLTEDPVKSTTKSDKVPQEGVSNPSYSFINQYSRSVGGDGALSFYQALEGMSSKHLKASVEQNERTQVGYLSIELMNRLNQDSLEFKQNSPTGEGYMEFMTSQVSKHKEDLKKNVTSSNISNAFDSFSMTLHKDWANKSFGEENAMRVASTRNASLEQAGQMLAIVRDAPENKDAVWVNYKNAIENCKGILPAQDYQQFEKKLTEDFNVSVLLGHVSKDPYNAMALLKDKEHTKGVSLEKVQQLKSFTQSAIRSLEKQQKQSEKVAEADFRNRANIEMSECQLQLASGTLTEQDVYGAQYLSDIQKNKLLSKLLKKDEKTKLVQEQYQLICQHAETGTNPNLSHDQLNKTFEYEMSILGGQNGEPTSNVYAIQGAKYHTNLNKYCKKISNAFKYGGVQDVVEAVGAFRLSQGLRAENISSINTEDFNAFATMVEASFNPNDKSINTYENIKRYREIIFDKERKGLTDEQKQIIRNFNATSRVKDMFDHNPWYLIGRDTGSVDIHRASMFMKNKLIEGMKMGLNTNDAEAFASNEVKRVSAPSAMNDGHIMFMAPEVITNVSTEYMKNKTAGVINHCLKDSKEFIHQPDRVKGLTKDNLHIKDCTKDFNKLKFKTGSSHIEVTVLGEHLHGSKYNLFYFHPVTKAKVYLKDPKTQYLTNKVVSYDGR